MPEEPKFEPRPGQVDFTNIRYAPVVNCVVMFGDKILLVERNAKMRLYPGYWNGVSGFLDDDKSIEEKVREEMREELGILEDKIVSIERGGVFDQEEELYKKTWIVHPILVKVATDEVKLDWEAQNHKWLLPVEAKEMKLLPGFDRVLETFFK